MEGLLIIAGIVFPCLSLCPLCGYLAYWATGGVVTPEVWQGFAVYYGATAPVTSFCVVGIWRDWF